MATLASTPIASRYSLNPGFISSITPKLRNKSANPTVNSPVTLTSTPPDPTETSPLLTLDQLEAQITELAGHLNAANHRWLMLIAEFDRREGWGDGSTRSCAHWLSWKCGLDLGAAREKLRVARALKHLPLISASMAEGALSYSKVRALTRIASPETEKTLLMIALHGTAHHVETIVRQYRRAQNAAELSREAQQFASRSVSYFYDDDGSLVLSARLPAEFGAVLVKALEVATDDLWCGDVSAETSAATENPADAAGTPGRRNLAPPSLAPPSLARPSLAHRRADALAQFAESFLKHGMQALNGGERQQIVVHVEAETLRHSTRGRCELEGGPSLSAQTARRLACDSSVITITEDDSGHPLNVSRKTRSIPPAIRRALRSRDHGCAFPGCTHTRFLDGHHVRHWADGGETKLSNLVLLCRFHHRLVHEGVVKVQILDDGALQFGNAQGKPFKPSVGSSGSAHALRCQHLRSGLAIDANTAVTRWRGERMDHGLAIEGLLAQHERYRRVSAETTGSTMPNS